MQTPPPPPRPRAPAPPPQQAPQQAPQPQQVPLPPQQMQGRHYSEQEVEQIFSGTMDAVFSDAEAMRAQILSNPSKYGPAVMKLVNEHGMELMQVMNSGPAQEGEPPQDSETPQE